MSTRTRLHSARCSENDSTWQALEQKEAWRQEQSFSVPPSASFAALASFLAPRDSSTYTVWSADGGATDARLYVSNGTLTLALAGAVAATGGAQVLPGTLVRASAQCAGNSCYILSYG